MHPAKPPPNAYGPVCGIISKIYCYRWCCFSCKYLVYIDLQCNQGRRILGKNTISVMQINGYRDFKQFIIYSDTLLITFLNYFISDY